jgi:hypothetical protein
MLRASLVVAVTMSMANAVLAQLNLASESECADRFKATDLNKDNVLTVTEIPKAQQMPPPLAKGTLITSGEYVAACKQLPSTLAQSDKPAPSSPHSTGPSVSPEDKGQQQPQGQTGPLETKSGGAPAESPQGQTPGGMQPAPDGSSKTMIDPDTNK